MIRTSSLSRLLILAYFLSFNPWDLYCQGYLKMIRLTSIAYIVSQHNMILTAINAKKLLSLKHSVRAT